MLTKRQAFYKVCDYEEFLKTSLAPRCKNLNQTRLESLKQDEIEATEEDMQLEKCLNDPLFMSLLWLQYPSASDRFIERKIKQKLMIRKIADILL